MAEYQDRFDSSRYASDEPVSLAIDGRRGSQVCTIPERLFSRAQQIAGAYELHLLPAIDYYGEIHLNREQVQTLLDEMTFIQSVATDPLLSSYLQEVQTLLETFLRSPTRGQLVVQGP